VLKSVPLTGSLRHLCPSGGLIADRHGAVAGKPLLSRLLEDVVSLMVLRFGEFAVR
jgi:hypothetical protein